MSEVCLFFFPEINGFDEDLYGDIAPIEVITSLGALWRFGLGHQDAHELFHVVLSALQSETRSTTSRVRLKTIFPHNYLDIYLIKFQ